MTFYPHSEHHVLAISRSAMAVVIHSGMPPSHVPLWLRAFRRPVNRSLAHCPPILADNDNGAAAAPTRNDIVAVSAPAMLYIERRSGYSIRIIQ